MSKILYWQAGDMCFETMQIVAYKITNWRYFQVQMVFYGILYFLYIGGLWYISKCVGWAINLNVSNLNLTKL